MKFSLIAAVVLLALAQGSFAQDVNPELFSQYIETLKSKMTEMLSNQDMTGQAQTALEDGRKKLEPLVSQFHDQLKTVATSVDEHMRPLAQEVETQLQPILEGFQKQIEDAIKRLAEQTKGITQ